MQICKTPLTYCQWNANNRQTSEFCRFRRNWSGPPAALCSMSGSEFQTADQQNRSQNNKKYCSRRLKQSVFSEWQTKGTSDWQHQRLECCSWPYTSVFYSRHQWTVTASLYCTRCRMLSQCTLSRISCHTWPWQRSHVLLYSALAAAHQWWS